MDANFESELMQLIDEHKDEMIKIRRYLHEHPEPSFHEKHTAEFIKNYYRDLDCKVHDCGDGYGIVVDINADKPGKKLAWRARTPHQHDCRLIDDNAIVRSVSPRIGIRLENKHETVTYKIKVCGVARTLRRPV